MCAGSFLLNKHCKKKSHPPEKMEVASTKILGLHRFAPICPGPELCMCAALFSPEI